jgi:hypothetical protein
MNVINEKSGAIKVPLFEEYSILTVKWESV